MVECLPGSCVHITCGFLNGFIKLAENGHDRNEYEWKRQRRVDENDRGVLGGAFQLRHHQADAKSKNHRWEPVGAPEAFGQTSAIGIPAIAQVERRACASRYGNDRGTGPQDKC